MKRNVMLIACDRWAPDPARRPRSANCAAPVRAREIKRLLVERGAEASQLETVGYGRERPLATGSSAADQALNRRGSFITKEVTSATPER